MIKILLFSFMKKLFENKKSLETIIGIWISEKNNEFILPKFFKQNNSNFHLYWYGFINSQTHDQINY